MKKFFLIISLMLFVTISLMRAQDISPQAEITTAKGDVVYHSHEAPFAGSAPIKVHFTSGCDDHDGYFLSSGTALGGPSDASGHPRLYAE